MLKSLAILLSVSAVSVLSSPAILLQRAEADNIVSITDETNFWLVYHSFIVITFITKTSWRSMIVPR
jgi:hypothetical protein